MEGQLTTSLQTGHRIWATRLLHLSVFLVLASKCCWHHVTLSSECQRGEKFRQARRSNHDPLVGSQMVSPRLL